MKMFWDEAHTLHAELNGIEVKLHVEADFQPAEHEVGIMNDSCDLTSVRGESEKELIDTISPVDRSALEEALLEMFYDSLEDPRY